MTYRFGGTFRIFLILFCSGERRGSPGQQGGGGSFFIENPRGRGLPRGGGGGGGGGGGQEGVCKEFGGGGG